jgi:hypothetical protein
VAWNRGEGFDSEQGRPIDDPRMRAVFEDIQRQMDAQYPPSDVPPVMERIDEPPDQNVYPLLIRSDYTDEAAWAELLRRLDEPQVSADGVELWFKLTPIEAEFLDGTTAQAQFEMRQQVQAPPGRCYIADSMTMTHPEHPLLVMFADEQSFETCRVIPEALGEVDVNLALGNTFVSDFERSAGPDGIFRGLIY